ncbi:hypothetical protein PQ478_08790 [Alkalihalophilus pseudofirmus]|uniref:hypothetical protein n=1 Tax=Alkalihalophilus pseudofirmus TaxID=79885 RepID=UPI00259B0089|nr:hypothetical protein [Alkalihalophilus pseudofirmus]WEG18566.1 hypothetical protein PQ478_08790 [Alkalihalophilus pseudofirmus]
MNQKVEQDIEFRTFLKLYDEGIRFVDDETNNIAASKDNGLGISTVYDHRAIKEHKLLSLDGKKLSDDEIELMFNYLYFKKLVKDKKIVF